MCVFLQADGHAVIIRPAVTVEMELNQLIDLTEVQVHVPTEGQYKNMASAVVQLERIVIDNGCAEDSVTAEEGDTEGVPSEVHVEGEAPKGVNNEGDTSNEVHVEEDAHKEALAVGGMPEEKAEGEVEKGTVVTVCGEDLFTDDE
jgi:hypothetical protein